MLNSTLLLLLSYRLSRPWPYSILSGPMGENHMMPRPTLLYSPSGGLAMPPREVLLNQSGQLAWMEQTKVWKAYRKLKGDGAQRQEK